MAEVMVSALTDTLGAQHGEKLLHMSDKGSDHCGGSGFSLSLALVLLQMVKYMNFVHPVWYFEQLGK